MRMRRCWWTGKAVISGQGSAVSVGVSVSVSVKSKCKGISVVWAAGIGSFTNVCAWGEFGEKASLRG
jgi:hypothetical protein